MAYTPYGKDAVAKIIKSQIGFWAFAEIGARGFLYDEKSLYFDAKPRNRIVRVVVTLDPSDTYTVRVLHKKTGKAFIELDTVYADELSRFIRELPKTFEEAGIA